MGSLRHSVICLLSSICLGPSKFKARDVKISKLLSIAVVVVNHKGGDIGAASLARGNLVNVLDGEIAHAVCFDLAFALVEVNNVLVVQGFDDRAFIGAKEGDKIVFGDEVVHGVCLVTG